MRVMEVIRKSEGGMKEHYIALVKGLINEGCNVDALCDYPEEIMVDISRSGAKVYDFGFHGELSPINDIKKIIELCTIIRSIKPDIIHCHGFKAGIIARLAGWLVGCPSVYTVHNFVLHNRGRWSSQLIKMWERFMAGKTSTIITVSQSLKNYMINEMGLNHGKIHVIYNSRPSYKLGDRAKTRELYKIEEKEIVIGTVARLIQSKGIDLFLNAIPQILELYPKTRVMIVGSGPDEGRLHEIADNLMIADRVIFTGQVHNINDYYAALDIFILPTLSEGLGISVLEAMSLGLPVIASNTGGIPELITHKKNGYLIEPGNSENITSALIYYLQHPQQVARLGQQARIDVQSKFSIEEMIHQTMAVFNTAYRR